jgi:hypothetical protein
VICSLDIRISLLTSESEEAIAPNSSKDLSSDIAPRTSTGDIIFYAINQSTDQEMQNKTFRVNISSINQK